jgi:DHA1 family inner membrane transport protein
MMAEASARVADRQRGRVLGWIMAGQSMTLLVGVPLAAWIGSFIGWRGVSLCVAGVSLAATAGLLITTLRPVDALRVPDPAPPDYRAALSGRIPRLLIMGVLERICYALVAVYFATFLQSTYSLTPGGVVVPLAVFALGNILGTIIGGQMADRLRNRMLIFSAAMLASAAVALPLFSWTSSLAGSVALAFAYVFINALARPSLMAALANVPAEIRGTVLGLNVTSASCGWLGAASLGGVVMAQCGFVMFGPLAAGVAVLGGVLALVERC